ncbi:class I SAM-dependent methyltransferase [Kitasatospora viridis]|uniref:Leucine carboxyl methyltransferase n=1 Tax=Kitasatospora viridis TaxID=281105 RepID=A0A561SG33_9ACTN|nr:class I SAM-dependent methyltransferase [Kitasatospora viridis]TWF73767.1 leucine carboxyl methyltransferase [Kitasatospora viridis]
MTSDEPSVSVELDAVPETALWTLYQRAAEARRPDAVLHDPKAVELVDRIDYPFAERFGTSAGQAQLQALRVGCFDREVADFLAREPRGTVVCLGEGLETQYWRVDNGRAQWLTVDLPESVGLRERLLPPGPRQRYLAADATDLASWADLVDREHGVLITCQGLLMYLQPARVRALLAGCAEHFPGGSLVLDAVPHWFGRLTRKGKAVSHGYHAPPMPWAMDAGDRELLRSASPAIVGVREVRPTGARGPLAGLVPLALNLSPLAARLPSVAVLDFAER